MNQTNHPLSEQEFWSIYKKVPRLTVEIILRNSRGLYLTERQIEPCSGLWHFPGGTVRFGENLFDAVKRIANRELGILVKEIKLLGTVEYPSHYLNGLDCPVGIAYEIIAFDNEIHLNEESSKGGWFNELPEKMHDEQKAFVRALAIL